MSNRVEQLRRAVEIMRYCKASHESSMPIPAVQAASMADAKKGKK